MKYFSKMLKLQNNADMVNFRVRTTFLRILAITLLVNIQFAQISAQVKVDAGDDWAVCHGDILDMSDLNAHTLNINGDIWWETTGDGTFLNSILFNDATQYVPGPDDENEGFVILKLYGREFNPNGPLYMDEVTLGIGGPSFLACNDLINFTLNANGEFYVNVAMLLEGEVPPLNLYTLEIYNLDGELIPGNILNGSHIGATLDYAIGNLCDENKCTGSLNVMDNFPPILYCQTDTISCLDSFNPEFIGFPLDTSIIDTMYYIGENTYYLVGWDACADATLSYSDQVFQFSCDSIFQELKLRTWVGQDLNGNSSSCVDSILVNRVTINDIILPANYNNMDSAALECNGDWLALPNGFPSPDFTGYPIVGGCSDISYQYVDTKFEGCGSNFDIYRDWSVVDWCTLEILHWGQVIKIMDSVAPEFDCVIDTIYVGADPYNCYSKTHQINVPDIYDDCSDVELEVNVYKFENFNTPAVLQQVGNDFFFSKLPMGNHLVHISAIDECGNKSNCSYIVIVEDDIIPYAICDEHTQVSLTSNGIARLFANTLDDGSYDNCGIEKFEVSKLTDACGNGSDLVFGPYVDFCCEEVGDTVEVSMKITDFSGNINYCTVEVFVDDKDFPSIICPPDITVSCDFYYNPDNLDAYFGKVVTDPADRQNIVINDYYNSGTIGQDGLAYDNCSVEIETSVEFDLNECNVGVIYRTFTAVDKGGLKQPCLQRIFIQDPAPFDVTNIIWPSDVVIDGCHSFDIDTSLTGSPIVEDDACSLVAVSYEDQLFTIVSDACEKVVRTWTVIDWCQFDHNTLAGQWTYKQIIKLNNLEAPVFTSECEYKDICVYGNCEGLVELDASAQDDCTPENQLVWQWRIDKNVDGSFEYFGQGNSLAKILTEGLYKIEWTVEDLCGNQTNCSYEFNVLDCKLPTPYCISSLTTVVMNNTGSISITPDAYDVGSYDNCTAQEDLKLSWSQDVNDTVFTVNCDSLNGVPEKTFFLDLWVTDEAGNQDYCSIWLQVQDNFDVCDNGPLGGLVMGGNVFLAESNKGIEDARVNLECSINEYSQSINTNGQGTFIFDDLAEGYDYSLEMENVEEDCSKGVSTLDLVFIQRHILGLSLLDSPYKILAADANNTKSISGADILEIRKIVLGVSNGFNNSDCWKYVPKSQVFTNTYAPWNYKKSIDYTSVNNSIMGNDFWAVKTGDVNGSYGQLQGDEDLDTRSAFRLLLDEQELTSNNDYLVPVYANEIDQMSGLQFTMEIDKAARINKLVSGAININESNFAIHGNNGQILTFSWNASEDIKLTGNEPLFYVSIHANENVKLSETLKMNSNITSALVFSNFTENDLGISFRNFEENSLVYRLYQNEPNPFDLSTTIAVELPFDQEVELDIFDTNGRLVHTYSATLSKGIHNIKITKEDLINSGVYYYTVKTQNFVKTMKMIFLK